MTDSRLLGPALALGLLAAGSTGVGAAAPASAPAADAIMVPGGVAAISRLLGYVELDPDRFAASLNRVLLTETDSDNDWREVEPRVLLSVYLDTLHSLRDAFPQGISIGSDTARLRAGLRDIAGHLGYDVRREGDTDHFALIPRDGRDEERRRRVARALGWELTAIAEGVRSNPTVLPLGDEEVPAPLPLAEWSAIVGHSVSPGTALTELAQDQRLGLLIEGRRRLSREIRDAIDTETWRWIYDRHPESFYRAAASLRSEKGRLRLPGGDTAAIDWSVVVGARPTEPDKFLRRLLSADRGRAVRLWHATSFIPQAAARRHVANLLRPPSSRTGVRLLRSEPPRSGGGRSPDRSPYYRSFELDSLARSVLQGGSARGDDELVALAIRAAGSRPGRPLSPLRPSQPAAEIEGWLRAALDRGPSPAEGEAVIHAFGLLRGRDRMPREETFRQVVVTARCCPAALTPLSEIELEHEESLTSYLGAVQHLDRLDRNHEGESLTMSFQGGVEWLRLLARAGKVPAAVLEERLVAWAALHSRSAEATAAAGDELTWIADLLALLPAAGSAAPGRGPHERAQLQALVGLTDPQTFRWNGLVFTGRRALGWTRDMARRLEEQAIPSADQLLELRHRIAAWRVSCAAGDRPAGSRLAQAIGKAVGELPRIARPEAFEDPALGAWLLPVDRPAMERLAARIAADPPPPASCAETAARLEGMLAGELRPFLLAPSYLVALADQSDLLLADRNLIRKHRLRRGSAPLVQLDATWEQARLRREADRGGEPHFLGHPSGLPWALTDAWLRSTGHGLASYPERDYRFHHWHLETPWHRITPELSHLVAELVAAGDAIRVEAKRQIGLDGPAPHRDFAAERVPLARLERAAFRTAGSRLSPSERLMLGLAAWAGDEHGEPARNLLDEELARRLEGATVSLGPDWRRRLDAAGAPTPRLDGRYRPWVGSWPPYEAVEREWPHEALLERVFLDLKIAIIDYLGRHHLPASVGADLMTLLLQELSDQRGFENLRDWEGILEWLDRLDDARMARWMERCLQQGPYSAAGS